MEKNLDQISNSNSPQDPYNEINQYLSELKKSNWGA
jgi:hypothetical protein